MTDSSKQTSVSKVTVVVRLSKNEAPKAVAGSDKVKLTNFDKGSKKFAQAWLQGLVKRVRHKLNDFHCFSNWAVDLMGIPLQACLLGKLMIDESKLSGTPMASMNYIDCGEA